MLKVHLFRVLSGSLKHSRHCRLGEVYLEILGELDELAHVDVFCLFLDVFERAMLPALAQLRFAIDQEYLLQVLPHHLIIRELLHAFALYRCTRFEEGFLAGLLL